METIKNRLWSKIATNKTYVNRLTIGSTLLVSGTMLALLALWLWPQISSEGCGSERDEDTGCDLPFMNHAFYYLSGDPNQYFALSVRQASLVSGGRYSNATDLFDAVTRATQGYLSVDSNRDHTESFCWGHIGNGAFNTGEKSTGSWVVSDSQGHTDASTIATLSKTMLSQMSTINPSEPPWVNMTTIFNENIGPCQSEVISDVAFILSLTSSMAFLGCILSAWLECKKKFMEANSSINEKAPLLGDHASVNNSGAARPQSRLV